MIRERPKREAVSLIMSSLASRMSSKPLDNSDFKSVRYDFERKTYFKGKKGSRRLNRIIERFFKKDIALLIYLLTVHPFIFVPAVCASPFVFLGVYYKIRGKSLAVRC